MTQSKQETVRFPSARVREFVEQALLKSGAAPETAEATATGLWLASLRGVDSHGIRLLPHYLKAVKGGRIDPVAEFVFEQTGASTGRLDANHGFGHAAGKRAMDHAIALAREAGAGHVAVRNSTHCGSMAYFALEACKHDMIGMAFTNATPKMRAANARSKFFGTNPVCMAAPMADEGPFCYDGATTLVSVNKIRMHGELGAEIPSGWAADENGEDTTDPAHADQLLPMGGYKGFGMAMMVDIFCCMLTGMPSGDQVTDMFKDPLSKKRHLGHFFTALRIDAFEPAGQFKARLQETAQRIRSLPRLDEETPVMVPGDPEKAHEADRSQHGIPVPEAVLTQFDEIAATVGIEPLR